MRNQVISRIIITFVVIACLAVVFGLLFKKGLTRPDYRYPNFTQESQTWVEKMNTYNQDKNVTYANMGPFDWNNENDLGQTDKEHQWESEENATTIVYYHADKMAEGKRQALLVLELVDMVAPEIEEILGAFPKAKEMNGRKLPIYIPCDEDEYAYLVKTLSNGNATQTTSNDGCSVLEYGPLGCLLRGIVLPANAFKLRNGQQSYTKIVRREVMHYAYVTQLDYNQGAAKPYFWFTEGLSEYFAQGAAEAGISFVAPDYVDIINKQCNLNAEFPQKNKIYQWAGCSFFQYMNATCGGKMVSNMVQETYHMPVDSVFEMYNINTNDLKVMWVDTLMKMNNVVVEY